MVEFLSPPNTVLDPIGNFCANEAGDCILENGTTLDTNFTIVPEASPPLALLVAAVLALALGPPLAGRLRAARPR